MRHNASAALCRRRTMHVKSLPLTDCTRVPLLCPPPWRWLCRHPVHHKPAEQPACTHRRQAIPNHRLWPVSQASWLRAAQGWQRGLSPPGLQCACMPCRHAAATANDAALAPAMGLALPAPPHPTRTPHAPGVGPGPPLPASQPSLACGRSPLAPRWRWVACPLLARTRSSCCGERLGGHGMPSFVCWPTPVAAGGVLEPRNARMDSRGPQGSPLSPRGPPMRQVDRGLWQVGGAG